MRTAARRLLLAATALIPLAAAGPAAAHPHGYYRPPPPVSAVPALGGSLRIGLDAPSGAMYSGERLRNQFGPQLGIQGELGVRVTPQLLLGGYLGVGVGFPGPRFDAACDGGDCSATTVRFGLLAQYDFAPYAAVSPWIGYGFGFAASEASSDVPGSRFTYEYAGLELGHLRAGLDFRSFGHVGVGLYADWAFGVYRAYRWEELDATVADGSVHEPTVHQWFSFGPRISF
jgi:opacity protein-like surface antigen